MKKRHLCLIAWGARSCVFLDFMLIASCKLSTLVFCTCHLLQRWRGWTLTEPDHHLTLQMVQVDGKLPNRPFAKVQRQRADLNALDTGPIPGNDWWNRSSLINSVYSVYLWLVNHATSSVPPWKNTLFGGKNMWLFWGPVGFESAQDPREQTSSPV